MISQSERVGLEDLEMKILRTISFLARQLLKHSSTSGLQCLGITADAPHDSGACRGGKGGANVLPFGG